MLIVMESIGVGLWMSTRSGWKWMGIWCEFDLFWSFKWSDWEDCEIFFAMINNIILLVPVTL